MQLSDLPQPFRMLAMLSKTAPVEPGSSSPTMAHSRLPRSLRDPTVRRWSQRPERPEPRSSRGASRRPEGNATRTSNEVEARKPGVAKCSLNFGSNTPGVSLN